jgi:hypothetical protein
MMDITGLRMNFSLLDNDDPLGQGLLSPGPHGGHGRSRTCEQCGTGHDANNLGPAGSDFLCLLQIGKTQQGPDGASATRCDLIISQSLGSALHERNGGRWIAETLEKDVEQRCWGREAHVHVCQGRDSGSETVDASEMRQVGLRVVDAILVRGVLDEAGQDVLQGGSVEWEWLPEETVDPLAGAEAAGGEHGNGWQDVRECNGGDNRLDWSQLRQAVIGCRIVFKWGLNVVQEAVDGGNVPDALHLIEDAHECWPEQG